MLNRNFSCVLVLLFAGCPTSSGPSVDAVPPDAPPRVDALPEVDALVDAAPSPDASVDAASDGPGGDRWTVMDTTCSTDLDTFVQLQPGVCPATYTQPPACSTARQCSGGISVMVDALHDWRCDYLDGKLVGASVGSDVLVYCGNSSFTLTGGTFLSCPGGGTAIPTTCGDAGTRD